jgi:hypothetical protein
MKFKLGFLSMAAALLLTACGGSNSPNIPNLPASPVVYTIIDGYVEGASAYCMVNPNVSYSQAPNFKAELASNVNGKFKFSQACSSEIVALGGHSYALDGFTKIVFKGVLKAPAVATVLTPITTLMTGINALTSSQIQTIFGLNGNVDVLKTDPLEMLNGSVKNGPLLQKTLLVQQLVFDTTAILAKLGNVDTSADASGQDVATFQEIYQTTAASFTKALSASPTTVLIEGNTVKQALVKSMVEDAAAAVSLVQSNVETVVRQVSAKNIAQVSSAALAEQAATYLRTDPATAFASFVTLTNGLQKSTSIADTLAANVRNGALSAGSTLPQIDTVANQIRVNVTTTTTTTTISSTTTTTVPLLQGHLYLAGDSVDYADGALTQTYSLAAFGTGQGVSVNWPVSDAATLKLKLSQSSNFSVPSGYVTAALKITDATSPPSGASVKAYINQVKIIKEAGGIKFAVASDANAWVYTKSANGDELAKGFADQVAGLSSLVMSPTTSASIPVGALIRDTINRLGQVSDRPVTKYRVTLVLNGVDVRQDNGAALTSYTVDVPVSGGGIRTVSGPGVEGFLTVVNTNSAPVTTTSTTLTTVVTTTTTTMSPNNYLYVADNTVSYNTGSGATPVAYTMSQFEAAPGLAVPWPMLNTAAISFKLANGGAFDVGSGKTMQAAFELADADPAGKALVKAYIDKVQVTQSGSNVIVAVPSSAFAKVYARSPSGEELLASFGDVVVGTNASLNLGSSSQIELGNVVNNALARTGSVAGLVGKTYRMTLVLNGLSVRSASGATLSANTVVVPGALAGGGTAVSVTGSGLTGYITLGDPVVAPTTTSSSTTTTTSTASTTTTTLPSPYNYVYLDSDALSYGVSTGASPVPYSMSQFQSSPGIAVMWPMDNTSAVSFTLRDAGTFNLGSGVASRAAFEIKDVTGNGAQVTAYIDNVRMTQNGSSVTVAVPSSAFAKVYAKDGSGTEVLSSFGDAVAGTSATLSTAAGTSSSLVIGNVVNNALARMGSVSGLTGKTYSIRLVVENLPLRLANGTVLGTDTITLGAVSITGPSLTGFIHLTP